VFPYSITSSAMASDRRGSYRGKTGRYSLALARRFMMWWTAPAPDNELP
jgi:hypothetical protein